MRKLKILGGTHPDEVPAMACVDSLIAKPLPGVKGDIANLLARSRKQRYVDVNLVLAFPGNPRSRYYEERRADQLLKESQGFYSVIDLHNINTFGEDTAVINSDYGVSPVVLGFLRCLGMSNLVVSQKIGIQAYLPNSFALETMKNGLGKDIKRLRSAFERLANDPDHPRAKVTDFKWFKFLASPHIDQVGPDVISPEQRKKLRPFGPVPKEVALKMGLAGELACFMAWSPQPNAQGYWGEIVAKIATPNASGWPKQ